MEAAREGPLENVKHADGSFFFPDVLNEKKSRINKCIVKVETKIYIQNTIRYHSQ